MVGKKKVNQTILFNSKIAVYFAQIEKIVQSKSKTDDQTESLRHYSEKLMHFVLTSEKSCRDVMNQNVKGIDVYFQTLQVCNDSQVLNNVVVTLDHLTQNSQRAKDTISAGVLSHVLSAIHRSYVVGTASTVFLVNSHQFLARLAVKEKRFALRARANNCLGITLSLLRQFQHSDIHNQQVVLDVIKLYTSSGVNCQHLGRLGAVSTIMRFLQPFSRNIKHLMRMRTCLDILGNLTSVRANVVRAVRHKIVPLLLGIHVDIHQADIRNKNVILRKKLLTLLKQVVLFSIGKKAFHDANGLNILFHTFKESISHRELESLVGVQMLIMRRCAPRQSLPLNNIFSAYFFKLAEATQPTVEMPVSANEVETEGEEDEDVEEYPEDESNVFFSLPEDNAYDEEEFDKAKSDLSTVLPEKEPDDVLPSVVVPNRENLEKYSKFAQEFTSTILLPDFSHQLTSVASVPASYTGRSSLPSMSSLSLLEQHYQSTKSDSILSKGRRDRRRSGGQQRSRTRTKLGLELSITSLENASPQNSSNSSNENKMPNTIPSPFDAVHRYTALASQIKSVHAFRKVAIPDAYGFDIDACSSSSPLAPECSITTQRIRQCDDLERVMSPQSLISSLVYDLDECVSNDGISRKEQMDFSEKVPTLRFASMFECGNLRKAIQIRETEYDLVLNPDVNCNHHMQWFYFEVSRMVAGVTYRFNVINCEKVNSQFNFGMRPVMYSTHELMKGTGIGWTRCASDITYYRNQYIRNPSCMCGKRGSCYYTLSFTINFPYDEDIVYLAYHFPFTYTMLLVHLEKLKKVAEANFVYFQNQTLCETLAGNECPLITITAAQDPSLSTEENAKLIAERQVIFLTSRVHPGESNASWVMWGALNFLVSENARTHRERFVFKIIPMLNPDGVINGNNRCSLAAVDLNRCWQSPVQKLQPTIFHAKSLIQYLCLIGKKPLVFCDFHGHSRKKNIFLYGCNASQSWSREDRGRANKDTTFRMLPRLLATNAPGFCSTSCNYAVEKMKESTARVVVWRECSINCSYTLETTFSGFDYGPYKHNHIGVRELSEMGEKFCDSLIKLRLTSDTTSMEDTTASEDSPVNFVCTGKSEDTSEEFDVDTD